MNIVIIEDEQYASDALEQIITDLRPEANILASLGSIEDAVDWFNSYKSPELVFSDIQLSDGNSFEIFRQVDPGCPVIFTTAYNEYAIEAFKVNSIDYLLKPIQRKEVAKAIKKFEDLQQHQLGRELGNLQQLLGNSTEKSPNYKKARFLVKSGQSLISVPVEEAVYFLAEDGVVFLYNTKGARFIVNNTLDELNEELDSNVFFRANRQLIVHINAVEEVRPYFKGRLQLKLAPPLDANIIVSSIKASDFKAWLDK